MGSLLLEDLTDGDLPFSFGRYELQSVLGEGGMARAEEIADEMTLGDDSELVRTIESARPSPE